METVTVDPQFLQLVSTYLLVGVGGVGEGKFKQGTIWDEDVLTAHNEVRFVCVVTTMDPWKTFSVVKKFPEDL